MKYSRLGQAIRNNLNNIGKKRKPVCALCGHDCDPETSLNDFIYGERVYWCSQAHYDQYHKGLAVMHKAGIKPYRF